jgi:hypothetical protein
MLEQAQKEALDKTQAENRLLSYYFHQDQSKYSFQDYKEKGGEKK